MAAKMWLLHLVLVALSWREVMSVGRSPVFEYVRPDTNSADDQAVLMGLSSLIASKSRVETSAEHQGRHFQALPVTTEDIPTSPDDFFTTSKPIGGYTRALRPTPTPSSPPTTQSIWWMKSFIESLKKPVLRTW